MSLTSGTVPVDWKKAMVTPVFQEKGNSDDCTNYRPIFRNITCDKLLEKMVKSQVVHYLDLNNIFPSISLYKKSLRQHCTIWWMIGFQQ